MPSPAKVFIIYARKDEAFKDELQKHLLPLSRGGKIKVWNDRAILAGEKWDEEILKNLDTADLILVLISSDYFSSDYIHEVELRRALERHRAEEVSIVPVIVRDCVWQEDPVISGLQVLPRDGRPVETWPSHSSAFADVVRGLAPIIEKAMSRQRNTPALGNETTGNLTGPEDQYTPEKSFQESPNAGRKIVVKPQKKDSGSVFKRNIAVTLLITGLIAFVSYKAFQWQKADTGILKENAGAGEQDRDRDSPQTNMAGAPLNVDTSLIRRPADTSSIDSVLGAKENAQTRAATPAKPKSALPKPSGTVVDENKSPTKSSIETAKPRYYVHAGNFTQLAAARRQMEKVINMGYENAEIGYANRGKFAVVVVMRTNSLSEANKVVDRLEAKGVDAVVHDTGRKE